MWPDSCTIELKCKGFSVAAQRLKKTSDLFFLVFVKRVVDQFSAFDHWLFLLLSHSWQWRWTPDWARRPLVATCCTLELWDTTIRCTFCSAARGRQRCFSSTPTHLLPPSRSKVLFQLWCKAFFYWFVLNMFNSQSEGETLTSYFNVRHQLASHHKCYIDLFIRYN